ncbi:MAG: hypothetical protein N3E38_00805 [Candidatus Aenigmarchaeota archaeon]|nr:hypothetical protein [Candidatus Aenigmarchaeota archaeon]MCX8179265.1 hypothetical protein [Candidatus Aenigmarchaeota archaeon]
MPVIGFYLRGITANRRQTLREKIDINTTVSLTQIEKTTIGVKKKEDALNISFEFLTKYEPDIGEMKLEGNVLYIGIHVKEALNLWKKEKKILPEVDVEVKNFLFRKCMTIEINLAEDMSLPPPIMFPNLVLPKSEQRDMRYIG